MAKKDLRAQMDAARAAAAFIGAAQEAHGAEESKGAEGTEAQPEEDASASASRGGTRVGKDTSFSPDILMGVVDTSDAGDRAPSSPAPKRSRRQVKNAASDVTLPAAVPDFFAEAQSAAGASSGPSGLEDGAKAASAAQGAEPTAAKPKRQRKPRSKKTVEVEEVSEVTASRMTAQVLVPMTAEQREHADLLAQVMKITRAEVMRQALDEYWERHKTELQAAVMAYEELIRKLMK